MQKTEDKTPSKRGKDKKPNKDIPEMAIPLSQGLWEYFEGEDITVVKGYNLSILLEKYLYAKGLNKLWESILSLEGKIHNAYNDIEGIDSFILEELIDTIAEEMNINAGTFKHSLIAMALKE